MIKLLLSLLSILFCCYAHTQLGTLTLEEKVGQILMCHFNGPIVNQDAETLIQQMHIGGIIYYNWANELSSPSQVFQLSTDLQQLNQNNKIPLFIAIDQEGGVVSRLKNGFTVFPGNGALGVINSSELAQEAAYAIGMQLRAVGINMNLAPVVDVNSNPSNLVIGKRSFGASPDGVTSLARATLHGYHAAHILTSLKHFPGHGDVTIDSHIALPVLNKSPTELHQIELFPFAQLASEADSIMTAHLMVPSLDPKYCATLSKNILDILRYNLQFNGVIISDSLIMEGLLEQCASIEEAAVLAFNAGCDILLLGGKQLIGSKIGYELHLTEVQRIYQHLVSAVKKGVISESRLNESIQRILDLKTKHSLLPPKELVSELIHSPQHQKLAQKIADLASHHHLSTGDELAVE